MSMKATVHQLIFQWHGAVGVPEPFTQGRRSDSQIGGCALCFYFSFRRRLSLLRYRAPLPCSSRRPQIELRKSAELCFIQDCAALLIHV